MAITITIQIRKGGTGKTALAYNLAAMLAKAGFRVLVIDLDGQGSLTIKYGVDKMTAEKMCIAQLMMNILAGVEINYEDYIHHIDEHIDLIHGNNLSDGMIKVLAQSDEPIYVLADAIEPLKERYDYILIDNAPALNQMVSNSFVASDQILMCVTPTGEAIDNIKDTLQMYRNFTKRANKDLKINGILYNMVDEHTKDCRYWEDRIVDTFPNIPVYETAIRISLMLNEEEDRLLTERCDLCGMSKSQYLRYMIKNTRPNVIPAIDDELLYQLTKIGNNINQIARKLNSGGSTSANEVKEIREQLTDTLKEIRKVMLREEKN